MGHGLIGAAVRTGGTIIVNDVRSDSRYYSSESDQDICRAELCVPLRRGNEVVGVLDVQSTRRNAFVVDDATILETLGNLIAALVEKAELSLRSASAPPS